MPNPKEKLKPLVDDCNFGHLDEYISLLSQSSNPKDFIDAMNARGKAWGGGYTQVIGPIFRKLYEQDESVREQVHEAPGKIGIKGDLADRYFNGDCDTPVPAFLDYIPEERRQTLIQLADQIMLDQIKKHTGLGD